MWLGENNKKLQKEEGQKTKGFGERQDQLKKETLQWKQLWMMGETGANVQNRSQRF